MKWLKENIEFIRKILSVLYYIVLIIGREKFDFVAEWFWQILAISMLITIIWLMYRLNKAKKKENDVWKKLTELEDKVQIATSNSVEALRVVDILRHGKR